jgi:hypothetical protein
MDENERNREIQNDERDLERRPVDEDAIAEQAASELPDRDSMSLINADIAAPINAALALNVASDGSVANAVAQQVAPTNQTS